MTITASAQPDGQRRIVARRPGHLRRAGADPRRRSRRHRRAGAQPLQPVPRLRADARPARRRLARLQPRAHHQRARSTCALPPGHYYVYATRGPVRQHRPRRGRPRRRGRRLPITLQVESLASQLLPAGVVSGDFHVHGGASFDSAIPDLDRVVSFLATGVDVIIATDHNVVTSYASTLATLGATNSIVVIPGVEQTPNILWYYVPGDTFPKTLGHFNFWPLGPRLSPDPQRRPLGRAARARPADGRHGRRLRQPPARPACASSITRTCSPSWGATRATRKRSATTRPRRSRRRRPTASASPRNALARAPGGDGHHRNIDWDVEEVMTGASRADWLRYRALWFSLLNQGFLRAGTANSDSHSLSVERIGYPRNLVWGGHDQGDVRRRQLRRRRARRPPRGDQRSGPRRHHRRRRREAIHRPDLTTHSRSARPPR